jgi:hydroxymethylbilane synthase
MPEGARFGTSSIRRAAQIRRRRPDLEIVPFRGNVETRLRKLAEGVADATLLAGAGLNRLGMADRARQWLDPRAFLPAPAQGAIGIEYRAEDARMAALVAPLNHAETAVGVRAERALLKVLDGSCRTPIGALAELYGARLVLTGELLSPDGAVWHRATLDGEASDPEALGAALGRRLMERAGPEFLKLF